MTHLDDVEPSDLFDVDRFRDLKRRTAVVERVDNTTLVLGSTQRAPSDLFSVAARQRIEVRRRRSGGGAVLLEPQDPVWVDIWVPAGDELWARDVTNSAVWLGATWVAALRAIGIDGAEVWAKPLRAPRLGLDVRSICFGSLAPGEVTVAGRKIVGISQWRCRQGSLFHCALYSRWDPRTIVSLITNGSSERSGAQRLEDLAVAEESVGDAGSALIDYLIDFATGIQDLTGTPVARSAVVSALADSLPDRASWDLESIL